MDERASMRIEISNKATVENPVPAVSDWVMDYFTIKNPVWVENNRGGQWNGWTDRYLKYFSVSGDSITFPRGHARRFLLFCRDKNISCPFEDSRRILPEVDFTFHGELRPYQDEAARAVLRRDFCVLSASTGSRKTITALSAIAERKQPALIVVHTKELLKQWIDRIETFLGIPVMEIGQIGGGKWKIGKKVTVALLRTLYGCAEEVAPHVGHLIVDECHRTPSRTFTEAVTAFDARYMLGLSCHTL